MTSKVKLAAKAGVTLIAACVVSTQLNGAIIDASAESVAPDGSLWAPIWLALPMMASFYATPLLLLGLMPRKTREACFLSLLFILAYFGVARICISIAGDVRMDGFKALAQRSTPLVDAIARYEEESGSPPPSLDDLVPDYLPEVPSTGMGAYPDYEYITGDTAQDRYKKNSWVLIVPTPPGGLGWDQFMYFPNQNYPERGYGGVLERIQDWAYVHE